VPAVVFFVSTNHRQSLCLAHWNLHLPCGNWYGIQLTRRADIFPFHSTSAIIEGYSLPGRFSLTEHVRETQMLRGAKVGRVTNSLA
jgi:hypothetical protein